MSGQLFSVGDKVLASRDESGEDHEPATVVDSYELIIGDDRRPMVTVEFEDGERKYMKATLPNVMRVEPEEGEEEEPEAEEAESEVEAGVAAEADDDATAAGDGEED
jgi:hypothetical protein